MNTHPQEKDKKGPLPEMGTSFRRRTLGAGLGRDERLGPAGRGGLVLYNARRRLTGPVQSWITDKRDRPGTRLDRQRTRSVSQKTFERSIFSDSRVSLGSESGWKIS